MLNDMGSLRSNTATADARPKLVSIVALDGRDDSTLLALAASVAKGLETPVAAAIVESAYEREIGIRPVEHFQHTTAMGIAAVVDGHTVVLGNAVLFSDLGLSIENLSDWPERLRERGEQVLFVAVDGRTAGFLGVAARDA
jgi:cation transport ATPase